MMDDTAQASAPAEPMAVKRVRIWDAPVRLFHWALVVLIGVGWWTGENRMLDWHRLAGYSILALLLFRLIWGVIGSGTARFSSFVRGPVTVASYVKGAMFQRGVHGVPGHNPLGGWSVVAMLLLLATQVGLGLFAVDIDGMESGPFSYLVDFDTGRWAAEWHEVIFNVVLALIAIHVVGVLFYLLYRRDNLIGPMITGSRRWVGNHPAVRFAPAWLGLALMAACAGLVWLVISLWGRA